MRVERLLERVHPADRGAGLGEEGAALADAAAVLPGARAAYRDRAVDHALVHRRRGAAVGRVVGIDQQDHAGDQWAAMLGAMRSNASLHTGDAAELVTPEQAAELLDVRVDTVKNWISKDVVPYLRTGGPREQYLIPLHGMLNVLAGNADIAAGLDALDASVRSAGLSESKLEKVTGGH